MINLKFPKKNKKSQMLFFSSLALLCLASIFLILFNSQPPGNFKECLGLKENSRDKDRPEKERYKCYYQVFIENKMGYQKCLASGGKKIREVCGDFGGCQSETCQLVFYNPNFVFPKNYNECMNYFYIEGGKDPKGYYCAISFATDSTSDKKLAEGLYEKCLSLGGQEKKLEGYKKENQFTHCVLKFYEK